MTEQSRPNDVDEKFAEAVAKHDTDDVRHLSVGLGGAPDETAPADFGEYEKEKDSPTVQYAKAGIAYYEAALKAQQAIARANQMAAYAQLSMARSSPTTFYRDPARLDAMMVELEHALFGDNNHGFEEVAR